MKNENWDRFLPEFKKRNVQRKKPRVVKKKKEYTPFPPEQLPRKVDLQMASGEYFLNEEQKTHLELNKKAMELAEKRQVLLQAKKAKFQPPQEHGLPVYAPSASPISTSESIEALKAKFKARRMGGSKDKGVNDASSYILGSSSSSSSKKRKMADTETTEAPTKKVKKAKKSNKSKKGAVDDAGEKKKKSKKAKKSKKSTA